LESNGMNAIVSAPDRQLSFLDGDSECGGLIRAFDWDATSLGAIESWPQVVKTTVALILRSPVPIVTLWGDDGVMLYNDPYSVFAGGRHPRLLGSKVREGWPEVADFNDNVMRTVFHRGETLSYQDQELTLYRTGAAEQVWMNLDYSPVVDDDGVPAGVIAIVVETSAKVSAERDLSGERERLQRMFDEAPGFMALLEEPGHRFTMANGAYYDLVGGREIIGRTVAEALPEVVEQGFKTLLDSVAASGERHVGRATQVLLQRADGSEDEHFVDFIYQPLAAPDGTTAAIFVQGHDVTDHKRGEALTAAHNHALELTIQDRPLAEILEALVRTVEGWSTTGVLGSILIVADDGKHLRHGAAPSLPHAYNEAIDGVEIGPCVGSCGTAAFRGEPVFVSDIATDPLWADFRELATSHGLRACWSMPIMSANGAVLGTFAMYHREPRSPTEQDLALVHVITRTAALIIERNRAEDQRKRFERHQQLLVGELNHRVKNTLAIVQSLVHQTFHGSHAPDEAIGRFEGRLEALAGAHNLLTRKNWESASISEVVEGAIAPFCSPIRCSIEGPEVAIPPQTAVSLALAIHELATNASKYGALSNNSGTIAVRWRVEDGKLDLTWTERGGPPVAKPEKRGFGTRMIERTLAAEFGGAVELGFAPEGLTCRVVAKLPSVDA
jgi:PAS domain S-box-containing protein